MVDTMSRKEKMLESVGGNHTYGNLYGVDTKRMESLKLLKDVVIGAAKSANMHVVKIVSRVYRVRYGNVAGASIIALLEESHMVLHTWPEGNYVTIDIFSCGKKSDPKRAFMYVVKRLKPKRYKLYNKDRSLYA